MRALALLATIAVAAAGATTASAHNSGHITFPDGTCIQLGSQKDAPLVGAGNPNQNALGQLDLLYDPKGGVDASDQYGARWAAEMSPRIEPGDCPVR
jgi:hypothetical protein